MIDLVMVGENFRELRRARGLVLKDLENSKVSASQIGKFERGQTSITVDKMFYIIDRVNITIEEFFHILNGYEGSSFSQDMRTIHSAFLKKDIVKIKKFIDKESVKINSIDFYSRLNIIMFKNLARMLDKTIDIAEKDIEFLADYLISIDIWTEYEVVIFSNCMDILPVPLTISLGKDLLSRTAFYHNIPQNKKKIQHTLVNLYQNMIDSNEKQAAICFGNELFMLLDERDSFEMIHYVFLKSIFNYKFCSKKEALYDIENQISALETLGFIDIARKFREKVTML